MPRSSTARQQALSAAVDAIDSRFHAHGVVNRGLTLQLGGAAAMQPGGGGAPAITFPLSAAAAAASLPPLLAAARASPFGRGTETVLDPSVRVAKERLLAAGEFSVSDLS